MDMANKKGLEIKTAVVMNEDSIFGHYVAGGSVAKLTLFAF